jgi:uncharacterized protein (TIGR03067 family)
MPVSMPDRNRLGARAMKSVLTLLCVAAGLCTLVAAEEPVQDQKNADAAKQKAIEEDLKLLQGKWEFVAAYSNGVRLPGWELPVFTIEGSTMWGKASAGAEKIWKCRFSIDPTQSPKHMDVEQVVPEVPEGRRRVVGKQAYLIEGDLLYIANGNHAEERPATVIGKTREENRNVQLWVYRRVKE